MNRLRNFNQLKNHIMYQKHFKKLSKIDVEFCEEFLAHSSDLNRDDYANKINRLFLDKTDKPKNWTVIWELLSVSNTEAI